MWGVSLERGVSELGEGGGLGERVGLGEGGGMGLERGVGLEGLEREVDGLLGKRHSHHL